MKLLEAISPDWISWNNAADVVSVEVEERNWKMRLRRLYLSLMEERVRNRKPISSDSSYHALVYEPRSRPVDLSVMICGLQLFSRVSIVFGCSAETCTPMEEDQSLPWSFSRTRKPRQVHCNVTDGVEEQVPATQVDPAHYGARRSSPEMYREPFAKSWTVPSRQATS
jgi:hypothetical protein